MASVRMDDLFSVADGRQVCPGPVNSLTSVHETHHGRPPCEPGQRRYNSSAPAALWEPRESSQLQRRKKREIEEDTASRVRSGPPMRWPVKVDISVCNIDAHDISIGVDARYSRQY